MKTWGSFLAVGLFLAVSAFAGVVEPTPGLPPSVGGYVTAAAVHACFVAGGGVACLEQGNHGVFSNIVIGFPGGVNEQESFDSVFTGHLFFNSSDLGAITLLGPVVVETFGRPNDTDTGTFATEMLAMNLSGNTPLGPIMVRESPTLASPGQTSISGSGPWVVDSFFDVFTELSLDGGATWIPTASPPAHVVLTATPEPGTWAMLGGGILALIAARRRRK